MAGPLRTLAVGPIGLLVALCAALLALPCSMAAPDAVRPQQPLGHAVKRPPHAHAHAATTVGLVDALGVMQATWFDIWLGTWSAAIDWTAAVVNTHLVATLGTLSRALAAAGSPGDASRADAGCTAPDDALNTIDRYFAHAAAYYFAENDFALRNEANDDMLWVVLAWLDAIQFAGLHSSLHYRANSSGSPWHGTQWVDAFAHRAHVFYDIARNGWDTSLCGGGMVWNPSLLPYKNAITNELFIAASVAMYLYFPGDSNTSPFLTTTGLDPAGPHEPKFLRAAVDAYDWLKRSNMTNRHGLYVDGFHVTGYKDRRHPGTRRCDERNEMVFTYNQGVLLSGLRGLWESTGAVSYLDDGHDLIRNVIAATGWDLQRARPNSNRWAGIGRNGIMEEYCDHRGTCSQDGQTFKGIFFHHFTRFCEPLPSQPLAPGKTSAASQELKWQHRESCGQYLSWVDHNVQAALQTLSRNGTFGMWWGGNSSTAAQSIPLPQKAVDYRNDPRQLDHGGWRSAFARELHPPCHERVRAHMEGLAHARNVGDAAAQPRDVNDRGRGRTVEVQSGGVAVLRAQWHLSHVP